MLERVLDVLAEVIQAIEGLGFYLLWAMFVLIVGIFFVRGGWYGYQHGGWIGVAPGALIWGVFGLLVAIILCSSIFLAHWPILIVLFVFPFTGLIVGVICVFGSLAGALTGAFLGATWGVGGAKFGALLGVPVGFFLTGCVETNRVVKILGKYEWSPEREDS